MRRTAMVGGAVAVAAGSALVVAPSATVRIRNASVPVSVTTAASLDARGGRTGGQYQPALAHPGPAHRTVGNRHRQWKCSTRSRGF